jgi:hypothetical protein
MSWLLRNKLDKNLNALCELCAFVVNCPIVGSTLIRKNKPETASIKRPTCDQKRSAEEVLNQCPAVPSAYSRATAAAESIQGQ